MTNTNWPNLRESDFIIRDFRFASGETLPELRQHYITLRRGGAASPRYRGAEHPASEAGDGAIARRHADLDVRRDVSGLHGCARSGRKPARTDEQAQLDPAPHQCRSDPQRPRLEQRRLRHAADQLGPGGGALTQSVVRIQELAPTREKGDALYQQFVERAKKADANNQLYQIESTMDYDPSTDLEKIKAPLLAINFADDAVNPPELGVLEAGVARIPGARSVVMPAGPQSQGHYTSMRAALWKSHLADFLDRHVG
jgi:homoserine acetyltransferase